MKTIDKLAKIINSLKEMGCNPDKILVQDALEGQILVQVYYEGANKIDKTKFKWLMGDASAAIHVPEKISVGNSKKTVKNTQYFDIFY